MHRSTGLAPAGSKLPHALSIALQSGVCGSAIVNRCAAKPVCARRSDNIKYPTPVKGGLKFDIADVDCTYYRSGVFNSEQLSSECGDPFMQVILVPSIPVGPARLTSRFTDVLSRYSIADAHSRGQPPIRMCLRSSCAQSRHQRHERSGSPNCCVQEEPRSLPSCEESCCAADAPGSW